MPEQAMQEEVTHRWYARPVFFVSDLSRALEFYVGQLGFTKKWHEADGKGTVCQVDRSDCEIILTQEPDRRDRTRLFVELTPDGIAQLRREIDAKSIPSEPTWWGYDAIRLVDPDGNELLFPYE
jgi:catechol 2,3-dioxygenase-like lactoylglutathione lyase family enzyme